MRYPWRTPESVRAASPAASSDRSKRSRGVVRDQAANARVAASTARQVIFQRIREAEERDRRIQAEHEEALRKERAEAERQREALYLFDVEGLRHAEIAKLLGLREGNVRYHLFQARRALRDTMGGVYEEG